MTMAKLAITLPSDMLKLAKKQVKTLREGIGPSRRDGSRIAG